MQATAHLDSTQIEKQTLPFSAIDGYVLVGIRYSSSEPIKANIIVASATGVPQQFYRRFAEYTVALGYQVLTFDYRGVGLSAPKQIKGFGMSYLD